MKTIDASKITNDDLAGASTVYLSSLLDDEQTQICGIEYLQDLKDLPLLQVLKLNGDEKRHKDEYHYIQVFFIFFFLFFFKKKKGFSHLTSKKII